ncbi:MAG: hypothetical protein ACI8PQ_000743 [Planctomycetota bacterium]|jgi:hypothetical protein
MAQWLLGECLSPSALRLGEITEGFPVLPKEEHLHLERNLN